MPTFDVTTFGEGGLQLSVPVGHRIATTDSFTVRVSGTEGGLVSDLSRLGWRTAWVSGLAKTFAGERVAQEFRSAGVDLSRIVWQDSGRTSIYYVEYASPPRSTTVLYDRKDSCITRLTSADIDWDFLLDTQIIHMSGITVPLSENCQQIVREALRRAKASNITTSFDVNYRTQLWEPTTAKRVLNTITSDVDILFCNYRDSTTVLGYSGTPESILKNMVEDLPAQYIVMPDSENGVYGWDGKRITHVPARKVKIVDRVGAGDALAAGVLHGYLQGDFIKGLHYGVTMSALVLSQYGEIVITTSNELEALLSSNSIDIVR